MRARDRPPFRLGDQGAAAAPLPDDRDGCDSHIAVATTPEVNTSSAQLVSSMGGIAAETTVMITVVTVHSR